ncbi:MAG: rRNA pseudouridine synthase [Clostridia bacterium]|nr:rRNA pseudouridine synthase [Clostridia bacterium]
MEPIRLQKYFTDCGVLSRRAAEAEIEAGHVTVNGERATLGQKIDPEVDRVLWKGQEIKPPRKKDHVTVLLNKPAGFVTTTSDEEGRPCVTDLLSELNVRLYPVGRLDMNSTGLLLLTNDGELANLLTHPRHHVPKVYRVTVGGEVQIPTVRKLSAPMTIDGYRIRPVKVDLIETYEHKSVLEMTLSEGRNRQIRKMCAALDLHVLSLERIAMGPIVLGHLPLDKFRHLAPNEVEALRNAAIKAGEQVVDKPQAFKPATSRPSAPAKSFTPKKTAATTGRAASARQRKDSGKRAPSAAKKPTGNRGAKGVKS